MWRQAGRAFHSQVCAEELGCTQLLLHGGLCGKPAGSTRVALQQGYEPVHAGGRSWLSLPCEHHIHRIMCRPAHQLRPGSYYTITPMSPEPYQQRPSTGDIVPEEKGFCGHRQQHTLLSMVCFSSFLPGGETLFLSQLWLKCLLGQVQGQCRLQWEAGKLAGEG